MPAPLEHPTPTPLPPAAPAWPRRLKARLLAGLAAGVLAAAPAAALPLVGPFTPGHIGSLDNRVALLNNAHPGETAPFYDLYTFTVDEVSGLFALALDVTALDPSIPPSETATLFAVALLDDAGALLALDETPADGFTLAALLPGAGFYGLLVGGVGGSGLGLYAALVSAEHLGVAAPPALALVLVGLALAAAARRRSAR